MRTPALLALGATLTFGLSCEASLESNCRDGECTAAVTVGAGGGDTCADAKGLPCDVYAVIQANCQSCHFVGGQGPFPLLDYDDTQSVYGTKPVWQHMQRALQTDAVIPQMPLDSWPLPAPELATMNAWFATCGNGAGGAGGAGGPCKTGPGDPNGGSAGGAGGGGGATGSGGAGVGGATGSGGAGGN